MDTYLHPTLGLGEIISSHDGVIAVKFPDPPGMDKKHRGIVPTLIISTLINEEERKE